MASAKVTAQLQLIGATDDESFDIGTNGALARTVAGTDHVFRTQDIGTSEEPLDFGEIGAAGCLMYVKNLDSTNFVELRPASAAADMIKMLAGDVAVFRAATNTVYALADTAAVKISYAIIEL